MKKIITTGTGFIFNIIIIIMLISANLFAQSKFTKRYGGADQDYGNKLIQLYDGSFVIAGTAESFGAGSSDFYMVKTDLNGNLQWAKTYGGDSTDNARSVLQTFDKGFLMIGETYSFGSVGSDILIVKTDSMGNLSWGRRIKNSSYEYGMDVIETADSGFIIGGAYFAKFDKNGTLLWGSKMSMVDLDTTSDGGFIITGTDIGAAGGLDGFLVKTDSAGNILWGRSYGFSGTDYLTSVKSASSGGYVAAGYSSSISGGNNDIFVIKTDDTGNLIWSKMYITSQSSEYCWAVNETSDSSFVITGSSFGTYIAKIDTAGNILWDEKQFWGGLGSYSVIETIDGGFAYTTNQNIDAFIIKTDSVGNDGCNSDSIDFSMFDSLAYDSAYSISISAFGVVDTPAIIVNTVSPVTTTSCFICFAQASFTSNIIGAQVCQGGMGTFTNTSIAGSSFQWLVNDSLVSTDTNLNYIFNQPDTIFVKLLTSNASCTDSTSISIIVSPVPTKPVITKLGDTLIVSPTAFLHEWYQNGNSFLIDVDTIYSTPPGNYYVVATNTYGCSSISDTISIVVGVDEIVTGKNLLIYPNPSKGLVTIEFPNDQNGITEINVVNIMGENLNFISGNQSESLRKVDLNLQGLPKGMYFLEITKNGNYYRNKLIIK